MLFSLDAATKNLRGDKGLPRGCSATEHAESEYLDLVPNEEDAMHGIIGASITYRLAFGPNQGKKALTLQPVPSRANRMKASELVSK
ncbi:MAG: hypothetical protein ACI9A2_004284 [Halioglobus sp.]|jgi:hypothetical protein